MRQDINEHRESVAARDLSRGYGHLELHVWRGIAPECGDALANPGCDIAGVSRCADGPCADGRIVVGEETLMKRSFQRTAANERPQRVQTDFTRCAVVEYEAFQLQANVGSSGSARVPRALFGVSSNTSALETLGLVFRQSACRRLYAAETTALSNFNRDMRRQPLHQNPLRRFAKENVFAGESGNQLIVGFGHQIKFRSAWPVAVAQSIQSAFEAVHSVRIASRVLRTMVSVIPVEDVKGAVRSDFE